MDTEIVQREAATDCANNGYLHSFKCVKVNVPISEFNFCFSLVTPFSTFNIICIQYFRFFSLREETF